MKLLINSPAPISRTNDTAISPMTSSARIRFPLVPPAASRPPSFSVSFMSRCDTCIAGARPNMIPVTNATNPVKTSTFASILMACACEIVSGINVFNTRSPAIESNSPTAPPITASKTLSVKNCLVRRDRPAPRAKRNAISFCRAAARASNKLATFAHAINRTNPTAPNSTRRAGLMSPTTCSCSAVTTLPTRRFSSGYCWARRAAIVLISACACCRVTPGFIRAITSRK